MLNATVSLRSVLLVDSDPEVHRALADSLSGHVRQIDDLYDGQEALAQLRTSDYDVLVAGHGRNGLDGLKLLRRARAIRSDLKVIVTGEADPARALSAIRHRAYSYFHKPFAAPVVADMVQQALEAEAWKDDIRVVSGRPEWVTLDIRCKLDAAERTTHYLREVHCDLPQQAREDIAVAFRELLMNAIEHGGKYDPRKRVRTSLVRTSKAVIVHIHDPGTGFSFDFLPHAAVSNPAGAPTKHVEIRAEQGQRPGGFGILMSRNLVDELLYNERGNAVLFVKHY
jgi:CheY-like chemotaxis protein/anti-sigma regulatory factor (Ser/Thr protein kinase)